VQILDVDLEHAQAAVTEIMAAGGKAKAYTCDVSDQECVKSVFREIDGRGHIHILVNSAGIAHVGKLDDTSEADFDKVFEVNVKGVYNCMHACVEQMKNNGGGVILNMASIAASAGIADRFAYSMSKGAVLSMTYSVAKDYLNHNIRCNCISPARVHTPFVDAFVRKNYPGQEKEMFGILSQAQPVGRMAEPEEVATLALFLCSDEAGFITGADYPMDGGFFKLRG
jgi:NAD(P)-dependent dehydrogenase (short-subunit alcohol dehydrogenase family)